MDITKAHKAAARHKFHAIVYGILAILAAWKAVSELNPFDGTFALVFGWVSYAAAISARPRVQS